MKKIRKSPIEDAEKEERRTRMEVYLRRLWGEHEIDFHELIFLTAHAREIELSKGSSVEQVSKAPEDSRDFFVMIDRDGDLDFITDWSLSSEQNSVLAEINSVENQPCRHLPRDEVAAFKRILGGAMVCAIQGSLNEARAQLGIGREYLKKRTTERSRCWMLATTIPFLVALAIAGTLIPSLFTLVDSEPIQNPWSIGLIFGMLGAFLSILQRSGRKDLDSAAGMWLHVLEVAARFCGGAVAGLIIVYISISPIAPEVFHGMALAPGGPQVLGFLAGFIDKLIPSIVSKYQIKTPS